MLPKTRKSSLGLRGLDLDTHRQTEETEETAQLWETEPSGAGAGTEGQGRGPAASTRRHASSGPGTLTPEQVQHQEQVRSGGKLCFLFHGF